MPVILLGTLDTKGTEFAYVRQLLVKAGVETLLIDAGVLHAPAIQPQISRETLYQAAGTSHADILQRADRGEAIAVAARGAAKIVAALHEQAQVDGILSLGGSAGTTIGTAAMRALPFGIPKLMVSTLASGQVKPYVGVRDIMMLHSVVDISGLNRISRVVLGNAARAMIGMVQGATSVEIVGEATPVKPLVTATMFGVTTPCVEMSRKVIEEHGYEMLVFHATGTGGQTMESFIQDGLISGVLDITTTELADELVGGVLTAGPNRLTAAGSAGVPQVISVGAIDMVNFGLPDTVPGQFKSRRFYQHNPTVTLMRTTPEENDQLGKEIALKASAAKGPTAIVLPLQGVSAIDAAGRPFWWPEADRALFESIRLWRSPHVKLVELDLHINDREFAEVVSKTLLAMMEEKRR
jgi:uncharacterized protein (UPF0261 family)